jgi:hypothetical protein
LFFVARGFEHFTKGDGRGVRKNSIYILNRFRLS